MEQIVHEKNFEQWSGLSETYHDIRPVPPAAIIKTILSWLQKEADVVIDLGSGTGLSTTIWNDFAKHIIGIEPNDDMRSVAEKNANSDRVVFQKGVSNKTNLPSDYADVITVAQAFHWMDIDSTLSECYRVLKPGGVLAIYDFSLPPILDWAIERDFLALREKCSEIVYAQEIPPVHNDKNSYNDRIKAFGKFRFARESVCHSVEKWTLQKVMGFLVNISSADLAMKMDAAIERDVDAFLNFVKTRCGDTIELIFPYKMVIAVK